MNSLKSFGRHTDPLKYRYHYYDTIMERFIHNTVLYCIQNGLRSMDIEEICVHLDAEEICVHLNAEEICVHLDAEEICANLIPELRRSRPKAGLWID